MKGRTLEQLRSQYVSNVKKTDKAIRAVPGMRGPGPHGRGAVSGKPKNAAKVIGRLYIYIKPHSLKLFLVLLCMLFSTLTSLAGSYMLAPIINNIAGVTTTAKDGAAAVMADNAVRRLTQTRLFSVMLSGPKWTDTLVYLFTALALMTLIYIFGAACTYIQSRLMLSVSQGAVAEIRNDLFKALQKLPVRFFDSSPTGEAMSRFTNDVDNIDTMLNGSLLSVISGIITLIGTFVFMITTSWQLTLITILFIPNIYKRRRTDCKSEQKVLYRTARGSRRC